MSFKGLQDLVKLNKVTYFEYLVETLFCIQRNSRRFSPLAFASHLSPSFSPNFSLILFYFFDATQVLERFDTSTHLTCQPLPIF